MANTNLNIKDIKMLKLDKDYTYSYPYGHYGNVQLKSLKGKYEGLVFDVLSSAFVEIRDVMKQEDKFFKFDYKILKMWKNVDSSQFNGKQIFLTEKDQKHISSIVYSFIDEFVRNDKTKSIDNFKELSLA